MNYDTYVVLCNPCGEEVIATDVLLLNKDGVVPVISRKLNNSEYVPIIIYKEYGKIYKCPECKLASGTLAPEDPYNTYLFNHGYNCSNKDKIPVEI